MSPVAPVVPVVLADATVDNVIGLVLAVGIVVYLVAVLVAPERF